MYSSGVILCCSCTILVAPITCWLLTTCMYTMRRVHSGNPHRLFLKRLTVTNAQCLVARASCAAGGQRARCFLFISSYTKGSGTVCSMASSVKCLALFRKRYQSRTERAPLQGVSNDCYSFDGHAWTAKSPLRTYRERPGMVTYRDALKRSSSYEFVTLKDALMFSAGICAKTHTSITARIRRRSRCSTCRWANGRHFLCR